MAWDDNKTVVNTVTGGESTQVFASSVAETTQYAAGVECPVCRTVNSVSEAYCMDCGFLLGSEPGVSVDGLRPPGFGKLVLPDGTREFALSFGENSVGREGADILLTGSTVSRKHAVLTVDDSGAFIEDLGSTNGTFLDGSKLTPGERVQLKDGSELTLGSVLVKYLAPAESESCVDTIAVDAPADVASEESLAGFSGRGSESNEDDEVESVSETPAEPVLENSPPRLVAVADAAVLQLTAGLNALGRRESINALVVPDPYCSGRHAEIRVENGDITVVDLGSTNGTYVNGIRLEPGVARQLSNGDEVKFGSTSYTLEMADV